MPYTNKGIEMIMRRSALAIVTILGSTAPAWAIYGITTGPGSSDSTFTWVGSANGGSRLIIVDNVDCAPAMPPQALKKFAPRFISGGDGE